MDTAFECVGETPDERGRRDLYEALWKLQAKVEGALYGAQPHGVRSETRGKGAGLVAASVLLPAPPEPIM
eukprot:scaffold159929_cov20-Prasinocladus_malaysianus.AAC.3